MSLAWIHIALLGSVAWIVAVAIERRYSVLRAGDQLALLLANDSTTQQQSVDNPRVEERIVLKHLTDRLGQAGFFSAQERRRAQTIGVSIVVCSMVLALIVSGAGSAKASMLSIVVGAYGGSLICLGLLRYKTKELQRQILYSTPLVVESLIILVESGLGILPALREVVRLRTNKEQESIRRLLQEVYEMSASGIPFSDALERMADAVPHKILRHVLLHLDVSGNEGGELVPALRSLGDHAHNEWKTSIESRVKQLENIVVFPVFFSIIGLMLLVAAVPIVPVLDVIESLDTKQQAMSEVE